MLKAEDGIDINYPLTMNLQTNEEFKREILKDSEDIQIPINGFMLKEIDKNLNQVYLKDTKVEEFENLDKKLDQGINLSLVNYGINFNKAEFNRNKS